MFTAIALLLCAISSGIGQAQQNLGGVGDGAPGPENDYPVLSIGSRAPDFRLPGVDGKTHSMKDYAGFKILAVVFTCNHCPVAQMYEKRLKQLVADYGPRNVAFVAIMGNDDKAEKLSEWGYTDVGDSFDDMRTRVSFRRLAYPYLYDGATQTVTRKYGPTATPHVFIFDQQRILRYEGRIDSNPQEVKATKHEARDALEALLADKEVAVKDTPAMGCSTKWAFKEASVKDEERANNEKPVKLDLVSPANLKSLLQNQNADGELLFVNFWASWCAPCVAEFPDIEKMVRMYGDRQVKFVTVSINNPNEKDLVLRFLRKQHAFNINLLVDSDDPADAVTALGKGDWKGAVPYTVIIGQEGKILYSTQGAALKPLDARRALLKLLQDDHYIGQHAYWNSKF